MELMLMLIKTLKKYTSKEKTSETGPLSRTEIVRKMKKDYGDKVEITDKKIRNRLDAIVKIEHDISPEDKMVCYREYSVEKNGEMQERKTDYYYNNSITDIELKFLIDSVMDSKIFNSETAKNLAQRIQGLSGKHLKDITPYANESYGELRYTLSVNVMQNMEIILNAIKNNGFITFKWNVYDFSKGKIYLRFKDERTIKPVKLILYNGRYFMMARYKDSKKIYKYSVDLMTDIKPAENMPDDGLKDGDMEKNFQRAAYTLRHPFNMGGETRIYKLRVNREYFSRLVDTFSYEIKIIPGTETEETVDVMVPASSKGMAYWLLQHYEVAELINNNDENLERELSEAVEILYKRYHK